MQFLKQFILCKTPLRCITGALLLLHACAASPPEPASTFARQEPLINETNSSYERRASMDFPEDAVAYFERNRLAATAIIAGDCGRAIPLLEQSSEEYSDNGDLWRALADCKVQTSRPEEAIEAYRNALELGVTPWKTARSSSENPNDIMVEIARLYAEIGDMESAMDWLNRGLAARFDESPDLANDQAFAGLKSSMAFAALVGLPKQSALSREEEWRGDIEYLRTHVPMLHFDPDQHADGAALDRMLLDLERELPHLSDEQVVARLVAFVGALGAGHDIFWPVDGDRGALIPFALKFYMFTDGLYIIDAYDKDFIGSRVDRFGDVTANEPGTHCAADCGHAPLSQSSR